MRRPPGRLAVGLAAVVVLAGCTPKTDGTSASTTATSAAPTSSPDGGSYLALGDSLPFGFHGGPSTEFEDPDNFVGYPELVGEDRGLTVINASCPGETTASFLDVTAQSNGCENSTNSDPGYRRKYPLHVGYDSPDQSQLDFALRTLERHGDTRLITVQIGTNDALVCQRTTAEHCQSPAEQQAAAQAIQTNLGRILATLRGDGRYDGQIVVVNNYAFDYRSPAATPPTLMNGAIAAAAAANGATLADGFTAFQNGADGSGGNTATAGLVLPNDGHPTADGQRLLADTVESVLVG